MCKDRYSMRYLLWLFSFLPWSHLSSSTLGCPRQTVCSCPPIGKLQVIFPFWFQNYWFLPLDSLPFLYFQIEMKNCSIRIPRKRFREKTRLNNQLKARCKSGTFTSQRGRVTSHSVEQITAYFTQLLSARVTTSQVLLELWIISREPVPFNAACDSFLVW